MGVFLMKKVLLFFFTLFIIVGCSSDKEQVINKLKPNIKDKYNVVIFAEDIPSRDFQDSVGNIDELWEGQEGKINSLTYKMLYKGEERDIDYQAIFEIETYPKIVVLSNEGIVLQTNKLDELQTFLEK